MDEKQAVRERVWRELRRVRASRFPGVEGRIPNFVGAEAAGRRLGDLEEWRAARALKSNPDAPQLPVRAAALAEGKLLYMAVPRLREARPFLRLDPARLDASPGVAASIKGASAFGTPVTVGQVRRPDLVVCGTVAVNRRGVRIGKGGGYSDLEFALLTEAGRIDQHTVVATTVHPVQVLDEDLPETSHDFRVDLIVTPDEVIRVRRTGGSRHRPKGIVWADLDEEKIASIPALAALARRAR
jgi:5-formyltetrahydrofolate cyclo-ligase